MFQAPENLKEYENDLDVHHPGTMESLDLRRYKPKNIWHCPCPAETFDLHFSSSPGFGLETHFKLLPRCGRVP
jgi:hypothetical protein